jgi:hypothetical protein
MGLEFRTRSAFCSRLVAPHFGKEKGPGDSGGTQDLLGGVSSSFYNN